MAPLINRCLAVEETRCDGVPDDGDLQQHFNNLQTRLDRYGNKKQVANKTAKPNRTDIYFQSTLDSWRVNA